MIDASKIRDGGDWEVYQVTPEFRRSRLEIEPGKFIMRTEFFAADQLFEDNRSDYNDSFGKRFGEGQIVGRIPLNKFYQEIAPKIKEGDKDHIKWWLNQSDNRMYRTFRGKV